MNNFQPEQKLKEYFNIILKYSNFKLELLEDKISTKELYDIANFKVKYFLLQEDNFQDDILITKLISIGERIIDLKD